MAESKKRAPYRTSQEKLEDLFFDMSVPEQQATLSTLQTLHRMKLRLADQPKPGKSLPIGTTGTIHGPNYSKHGKVTGIGKEGELWYITDDGMPWSAFDVRFSPDDPQGSQIVGAVTKDRYAIKEACSSFVAPAVAVGGEISYTRRCQTCGEPELAHSR